MLKIRNRIDIKNAPISGIDCPELCLDKEHFQNYPKKILYKYNTNGFRDHEWPEDLSDVVWCVGDSFTVGIGQPFEETWPKVLESKLGKICLNLGKDGCSNDSISLRTQEIYKIHQPKLIVVMWSYFHRRRIDGKDVHFEKKQISKIAGIDNFTKNFKIVDALPTNIVHLLIPNAMIDIKWSTQSFEYFLSKMSTLTDQQIKKKILLHQLDYARDYHHFDIKTSKYACELIMEKIKQFDNSSKYPI